MANSYTSAQSQTVGIFSDPTAGWMRIHSLARDISKIIPTPNVNPTKVLQAIAAKTRVPLSRMFGKLIRRSGTDVRLYISIGRTTDQAANAKDLFYVKINIRTMDVSYLKKIPNPWLALMARRQQIEARQRRDAVKQGRVSRYSRVGSGVGVG